MRSRSRTVVHAKEGSRATDPSMASPLSTPTTPTRSPAAFAQLRELARLTANDPALSSFFEDEVEDGAPSGPARWVPGDLGRYAKLMAARRVEITRCISLLLVVMFGDQSG